MARIIRADSTRRTLGAVPCVVGDAEIMSELICRHDVLFRLCSKRCICEGRRIGRQFIQLTASVLRHIHRRSHGLAFLVARIICADSTRRTLGAIPCVVGGAEIMSERRNRARTFGTDCGFRAVRLFRAAPMVTESPLGIQCDVRILVKLCRGIILR